jgi:hypothetical protein
MFLTKPSISRYRQFRQSGKRDEDENLMVINMSTHYLNNNEPTHAYPTSDPVMLQSTDTGNDVPQHEGASMNAAHRETTRPIRNQPITLDFHDTDKGTEAEVRAKDEFQQLDPKTLKLLWHY